MCPTDAATFTAGSFLHSFYAMTDNPIRPPLEEAHSPVQTCRNRHRTWAAVLVQNEGHIDQLLTLLANVPGDACRSLNHRAADYAQGLDQLKTRVHRLRTEVVCTSTNCPLSTPPAACPDPRFVSSDTDNSLISTVSAEYDLLKERCQLFFGDLMQLNLI